MVLMPAPRFHLQFGPDQRLNNTIVQFAREALAFFQGRAAAEGELMPTRTARQISQDIQTTKEQLT